MSDFDILGLMDTHKALKKQGIDVPDIFAQFLTGIRPIGNTSTDQQVQTDLPTN